MTDQPHDVSEPRHEAPAPAGDLTFKNDPDGHRVTANMARGWIATVRTIRPEWKAVELAAVLDQLRDGDPVETNLALIAAALNPNVKHPDVLIRTGVWWDAAAVYPPRPIKVEQAEPFPSRRDRKRDGQSIRDTDAFQRNFVKAKDAHEAEVRARGGHLVTERNL